jgi:iron-sulfur cluster assembly protein
MYKKIVFNILLKMLSGLRIYYIKYIFLNQIYFNQHYFPKIGLGNRKQKNKNAPQIRIHTMCHIFNTSERNDKLLIFSYLKSLALDIFALVFLLPMALLALKQFAMICLILSSYIVVYAYTFTLNPMRRNIFRRLHSLEESVDTVETNVERAITITPKALSHLALLIQKTPEKPILRMGVRSGGCSGMSYVMDVVEESKVNDDDYIEINDGIKCAIDPKSLLFLYGLSLDYSDELIGGGFKFTNPNAATNCGCGKSFGV